MPDINKVDFLRDIIGIKQIIRSDNEKAFLNSVSSFESLKNEVMRCERCRLAKTRTNIVFGEGNIDAKLMFVGEGPGFDEDKMGKPFVGKAGKLLDKIINAMTLKREDVYIANIVKCRPPDNRNPLNDEISRCIGFLYEQIKLINPDIIVCLGSVATCSLLKIKGSITRMRGNFYSYKDIKVMPTFHPAYLLRNEQMKKYVWEDMQAVMKELGLKR